ncbi:DUF4124 domain-containing protein [Comamonas sp.]|uniref:DUF4124 domain-containing protein n=1 Tax=Comamonas sp. TaxID=34028 RepID=UPI0028A1D10D|nr:DUF4124 domain-containing protein [Comamonas sp.]
MLAAKALLACSIFAAGAAQAQIYKCDDENGRLLLSDKPCGALLVRKKSLEENYSDDLRAYEATLNKQEQRAKERRREEAKRMEAARYQQYSPGSQHKSYEENLAERNAGVQSTITSRGSLTREEKAEIAREKLSRVPPTELPFCSGGTCTDNKGGSYQQVSKDFMTGPQGQACYRQGNMWTCN